MLDSTINSSGVHTLSRVFYFLITLFFDWLSKLRFFLYLFSFISIICYFFLLEHSFTFYESTPLYIFSLLCWYIFHFFPNADHPPFTVCFISFLPSCLNSITFFFFTQNVLQFTFHNRTSHTGYLRKNLEYRISVFPTGSMS